jgi:hypothetical protein
VAKTTKATASELNLKGQKIHFKILLKPSNKPWVELLICVKIGLLKSSLNGKISPNLVTL